MNLYPKSTQNHIIYGKIIGNNKLNYLLTVKVEMRFVDPNKILNEIFYQLFVEN